jgi:hypothetical protein
VPTDVAMTPPAGNAETAADTGVLVLHALWSDGSLHLWAESQSAFAQAHAAPAHASYSGSTPPTDTPDQPVEHPFAAPVGILATALACDSVSPSHLALALPSHASHLPLPSPPLAHQAGSAEEDDEEPEAPDAPIIEHESLPVVIARFRVPTLRVPAALAPALLDRLEDATSEQSLNGTTRHDHTRFVLAESTRFFAAATRLVRHLLAQQRFVPMLAQDASGSLRGVWQPWLGDAAASERMSKLLAAMPPAARATVDGFDHDGAAIAEDFVLRVGDALCRRTLITDTMVDAIDGRDPGIDNHVAWLTGLLADNEAIDASPATRSDLVKHVRRWIGGLEDRGSGAAWRLMLRLQEPLDLGGLGDFASPGEKVRWPLTFLLQSTLNADVKVEAQDIWVLPAGAANVEGMRLEAPQEVLLAELGRAARMYKKLEKALEQSEPTELELTTSEAYQFLREIRPLLIEQGFHVDAPEWWDSPTVRLGARLQVDSEEVDFSTPRVGGGGPGSSVTHLGLSSLVSYRWQIAVGETNLTLEQFEKLAAQHSPLIRLNGRWVEIRPEDVKAAVRFIRENPGGQMEVGRAIRLAYGSDVGDTGIPVLGMDATGWVATVFGDARNNEKLPLLESPQGFIGTLRPYQVKGLSWLAFLDRFGLGSCLADDMGLGKTIQLLALLAHERAVIPEGGERPGPTLLVVPMSVVSNWVHEAKRFTPSLKVLVQHGVERKVGERLLDAALAADVVITTYALAHRDREHLSKIGWSRVVLDEAQNIKNPSAKQTRAVHAFNAPRRIALTGTPLENRLTELWSIVDFLNPGYLGTGGEFRRRFAIPVERYHDKHKGQQLRGLVQPFVLRRLKSDPTVISDLPEKVETKEYCYLTPEQATLYQTCVADMLTAAEKAEGIHRRGLVLAGLIKLKQICNHPAQFLKEAGDTGPGFGAAGVRAPAAARSGKCHRLVEMLQEVVAAGDKALVFTQFRQMGHILQTMLRQTLDREVLFLHGGTPAGQRQAIVSEFQGEVGGRRTRQRERVGGDGAPPVLILSLKAGGVGLNLTAANHVFHFDRWWNPAVEAQATDRAYRIGQTRTVQVHKFVVSGTLEERIDQMIEEKTSLAMEIIGAGEEWLTELSTGQLRDLLTLRADAVGDEDEDLEAEVSQ